MVDDLEQKYLQFYFAFSCKEMIGLAIKYGLHCMYLIGQPIKTSCHPINNEMAKKTDTK
jgi:hypothetical protein